MNWPMFDVDSHGATHTGRIRALNEDRYYLDVASGVFAVADGMGGHDAGEVASSSIVDQLRAIGIQSSAGDLKARFENCVASANRKIRQIAAERNADVIGSTLAALLAFERRYACLWAGDSRVYRLRQDEFMQLSRDHTEVQDLLDRGLINAEEAATWPRRNVITRAIGTLEEPLLDFTYGEIRAGDKFLLCSDGLTTHVENLEIGEILQRFGVREACQALVELALERGGSDNVTVVAVAFRTPAVEPQDKDPSAPAGKSRA